MASSLRMSAATRSAIIALVCTSCSNGPSERSHATRERPSYKHAVAAIARRQAADDSVAVPGARSILMTIGYRAPRVILLLHGLTDSPRQFEAFAYRLRADGNNVYVPRLPQHGLLGTNASALGRLTAAQLENVADSVVYDAQGLGDTVIVVGLSMGGTVGAWVAQERKVSRVVLIAPAIEPGRIPSVLRRPLIGLAARLPSVTRREQPDTLRPDRELGFNSRAIAEILQLGSLVLAQALNEPPRTREMTVLVNASDRTVQESSAEILARAWADHGAKVSVYELPDSLRLPHNILDAPHGKLGGANVLALLRTLAYGEPPPPMVRPVSIH